ncbi:hypothetical protein Tco_1424607, partial [Tanacetum coccineum]
NVDKQHGSDIDICRTESKHISDYLVYLLVTYPVILQIDIGMIRYRDTCAAEAMRFSKKKLLLPKKLGLTLKKMEKDHMWKVMSQIWIEILAYAATHCRGFHHEQ